MTDKELIQALRKEAALDAGLHYKGPHFRHLVAADRLEALLAENERLKAQVPRWRPVSEPPEKYGRYLCAVKSKVIPGNTYICTCDYYYDEDGFYCGFDRSYDVSHWMPLPEPPSTEGVE